MPPSRMERESEFRFYAELNDFLPPRRRGSFVHRFSRAPAVKDAIESLGVPHTEVDLILVDGEPVGFDHRLTGGERVTVYPVFERLDISSVNRLRPEPLREPRFIADVHLGTLARYLRLLGFDTAYENDLDDATIVSRSAAEHRIVLTRDRGILKRSAVTHGHAVRATGPGDQLREVAAALDLARRAEPFTRCLKCNGTLRSVSKEMVAERLPPRTRDHYQQFLECTRCDAIYWAGAHYQRLKAIVDSVVSTRCRATPSPGCA